MRNLAVNEQGKIKLAFLLSQKIYLNRPCKGVAPLDPAKNQQSKTAFGHLFFYCGF